MMIISLANPIPNDGAYETKVGTLIYDAAKKNKKTIS